jgi:hypothetical protein
MANTSNSAIVNSWLLQGELHLALKSQANCLQAKGKISKMAEAKPFSDARLFAYSPDTQRITIRVDTPHDDLSFWIQISFYAGKDQNKKLALETVGSINKIQTHILTMEEDYFILDLRCAQRADFWLQILVPWTKLTKFIAQK